MPLDLQKKCFRIEWLQQITKIRSAGKYKQIPKKNNRNEAKIHEKNGPGIQQKMLKNRSQKIKQYSKHDSQMNPEK